MEAAFSMRERRPRYRRSRRNGRAMTAETARHTGCSEVSDARQAGRIGVLLVNLGTPDATDYWSDAPLSAGVPRPTAA